MNKVIHMTKKAAAGQKKWLTCLLSLPLNFLSKNINLDFTVKLIIILLPPVPLMEHEDVVL